MVFGKKKKDAEKTALLVDVENGSVGAALVRLSARSAPKLFAETRIALPLLRTRDTHMLAKEVARALDAALTNVSEVAARVRSHHTLQSHGEVARVAVFVSPPWAELCLDGAAVCVPHMQSNIDSAVRSMFGDIPRTLHPFGTAAAHGAVALFPHQAPTLLCVVSHELTELLLIAANRLAAYATVPSGSHMFVRTLVAHGGVSPEEALSLVRLAGLTPVHTAAEALATAGAQFADTLADAASDLLLHNPATRVLVVAPEPVVEWLARSLSTHTSLADIFPQGTTVQAIRPHHAQPFIAAHAPRPDLPLMLEALFVDASHFA